MDKVFFWVLICFLEFIAILILRLINRTLRNQLTKQLLLNGIMDDLSEIEQLSYLNKIKYINKKYAIGVTNSKQIVDRLETEVSNTRKDTGKNLR